MAKKLEPSSAATQPHPPRLNPSTKAAPQAAPQGNPPVAARVAGAAVVESKPAGSASRSNPVAGEDVARAAYFRWLKKGGDAQTNWLEAEKSLRG